MHSILYGYLRYSIRKYNPKSLPRTKHLYTESCRLFFTALGILTINLLYSQDPDLIRSMHITGNNRTRTTYLNRFIHSQSSTLFDSVQIENDMRKLRNLPPIMQVEALSHRTDSGYTIIFQVEERFTLFPVGDFGVSEDNFWIGGGMMESNLLGRGLYAYGYYQFNSMNSPWFEDPRHSLHLIFRNPYFKGSHWGFELQLKKLPSLENSLYSEGIDFEIDYLSLSMAVRYEFRYENEILFGTSFRNEVASAIEPIPFFNDDNSGTRTGQELFVRHEIRKLDYHGFYINGWRNNASLSVLLSYNRENKDTYTLQNEFRFYRRISPKLNLATRLFVGLSSFYYGPLEPFIADNYYNFRGIGHRMYRGNIAALTNLELRQTLYETYRGGIQLAGFTDAGLIRSTETNYDDFHIFSGLGLRLIYKRAYNAILRIDYGVNMSSMKEGGWVIGWGQYF